MCSAGLAGDQGQEMGVPMLAGWAASPGAVQMCRKKQHLTCSRITVLLSLCHPPRDGGIADAVVSDTPLQANNSSSLGTCSVTFWMSVFSSTRWIFFMRDEISYLDETGLCLQVSLNLAVWGGSQEALGTDMDAFSSTLKKHVTVALWSPAILRLSLFLFL